MGCGAVEMDPSGVKINEEQDVERLQPDRLHGEEASCPQGRRSSLPRFGRASAERHCPQPGRRSDFVPTDPHP